jgi:hypothetical protein
MGKKKEIYEKEIADCIKKNRIMFVSHIFGYYTDIGRSQFYNLELDKSEMIKDAIVENRSKACGYMVNKWIASDNATLQIAGYRLVATEEERMALNQEYVKIDASIDNKKELTAEEAREFLDKLNKDV